MTTKAAGPKLSSEERRLMQRHGQRVRRVNFVATAEERARGAALREGPQSVVAPEYLEQLPALADRIVLRLSRHDRHGELLAMDARAALDDMLTLATRLLVLYQYTTEFPDLGA